MLTMVLSVFCTFVVLFINTTVFRHIITKLETLYLIFDLINNSFISDQQKIVYKNFLLSQVNENLGRLPLKDLYDTFLSTVEGGGRKVTGYFTHDTMMEMVFCALGLYKDDPPLQALLMDGERSWRTSYIGAFSVNLVAVLNR